MSRRYAQQGSGVFLPLAAVVVVVLLLLAYLYSTGALSNLPGLIQNATGTVPTSIATTSAPQSNTTVPPGGSTTISNYAQNSTVDEYALSLINNDRKQYGLPPVALSDEASGQQHSNNMLRYGYLSHWDVYGMKPYMRYTLLGGRGAVSENVAFISIQSCGLFGCHGNINVEQALKNMEYSMMYNDSQCCNNGHRDNILDPNHDLVSIGISFNSSTV